MNFWSEEVYMPEYTETFFWAVIIALTLGLTAYIIFEISVGIRRRKNYKEEIEAYSRRVKEAMVPEETKTDEQRNILSSRGKENGEDPGVSGKIRLNLENINLFYFLSQEQAKASFRLAVVMCVSGFSLMIIAVVLAVAMKFNFELSIIPAVGGIITELIAGTALVVYRNSLLQLNHYHRALHEDQRFLSSVELLGKFSSAEEKDKMLQEIIKSQMEMNLTEMKEAKYGYLNPPHWSKKSAPEKDNSKKDNDQQDNKQQE